MSKMEERTFGSSKTILKFNDFVSMPVVVSDTGIEAVRGRKIVPAGTIVAGTSKSVFTDPNEPVVKKNAAGAEGVLLNDVDVTHGKATGAMVIHGFIDEKKLPEAPAAAAKTALKLIIFMA